MPTLEQLDAAMVRAWLHVPAVQQLGGGDIAVTDAGRPWRVIGNDAVVYQLRLRHGKLLALRCPFSDTFNSTHAVQYQAMARDQGLEREWVARGITYFAEGLMLTRKGLRSEGRPVIAMEWIEGLTLLDAVKRASSRSDHQALAMLAHGWCSLVTEMEGTGFIHGDLNPENALVGPAGRMKLIDYDTSAWPGSPHSPSGFGTPGFVHPRATPRTHGAHRDAFASLVVYVSLRALAVRPDIWDRARTQRGRLGQELLFSAWDLAHSGSSPVFAELHQIGDQHVQAATAALAAACDGGPDMVPTPGAVCGVANPRPTGAAAVRGPAGRADWRVADPGKGRLGETGQLSVGRAAPTSEKRDDRAELVRRLRTAVEQEDSETVARIWPEVRDDRRVSSVVILAADILQRRFGKTIADALREGDDSAIVATVREAEHAGVTVTASTRRAARAAARRVELRNRLAAAISAGDRRTLVEIGMSPELEELHPLDEGTSSAVGHALAAAQLDRALRVGDDAEVATIVRSDDRLDVSKFDDAMRARTHLAIQRVEWVESVRSALRERDGQALEAAFRRDPGGARDPLSRVERSRAERMIERERATQRLNRALADGSDEAVLAAMNRVMASGAPLPSSMAWEKVRNAVDHVVLIEALREATGASPPDHIGLARLLPAARLLSREAPSLVAEFDLDELEHVVLRATHRARVLSALAEGDDEAIAEAADPDAFGILASLNAEQRGKVEQAVAAVRRR